MLLLGKKGSRFCSKKSPATILIFFLVLIIFTFMRRSTSRCPPTVFPNTPLTVEASNGTNFDLASDTSLKDILITVKTTKKNHETRLSLILKTWFKCAPKQTFFFTDTADPETKAAIGDHLIETNCNPSHSREDLCCKTGSEFEFFYKRTEKWWCEFDDDNYVNTDRLVALLKQFNHNDPVLIGRRSRKHSTKKGDIKFTFPTGGAGVCFSRTLAKLTAKWLIASQIKKECNKAKVSDDMMLGYVVTGILKLPLYESLSLHSHIENLKQSMKKSDLKEQVSFSYNGENVTPFYNYKPAYTIQEDPTRFLSLHRLLHFEDNSCA